MKKGISIYKEELVFFDPLKENDNFLKIRKMRPPIGIKSRYELNIKNIQKWFDITFHEDKLENVIFYLPPINNKTGKIYSNKSLVFEIKYFEKLRTNKFYINGKYRGEFKWI